MGLDGGPSSIWHHLVIRPSMCPQFNTWVMKCPWTPRSPLLITTCCLLPHHLLFLPLRSISPLFPPGVIGDQGGIPEPPGAEAHRVVDNLDCGEVWFFPPKPNGCGAVWFRMDMGGGQGWPSLDGQVWRVKIRVWEWREDTHPSICMVVCSSQGTFFYPVSFDPVSWVAPFSLHRWGNWGSQEFKWFLPRAYR